jgi:hypothetical protein
MTVDVAVSSINSEPVSTIIPEGLRIFELCDQLAFIRDILKYLQSDHVIDKVQKEKGIEVVQACDLRISSPRFSASLRPLVLSSWFPPFFPLPTPTWTALRHVFPAYLLSYGLQYLKM